MSALLLRSLPAVGHKIPPKVVFSALMEGKEELKLGLFDDALDIVYTSSGSAALVVSLLACKMASRRRKVVIPAYTCPSVLATVERAGLQAVLCDLAPGKLHLDEKQLEDLLDGDTLAVVYVHLFGLDRRANTIKKLVKNAGALLIEDAAQAFGNKANGNYLGTDGDLTILSFGRGKPLSALHGGAVIVNKPELVDHVHEAMNMLVTPLPGWFRFYYRLLLSAYTILFNPVLFSIPQALPWFRIGETRYIDDVQVHHMTRPAKRVLFQLLKKRKSIQKNRTETAMKYLNQLQPFAQLFVFLPEHADLTTGPLRLPVVFKERNHKSSCLKILSDSRLGVSGSYPTTLNEQPGVPDHVATQGPFSHAEAIALGILTLPTHEYVREKDIKSIVDTIGSFAR